MRAIAAARGRMDVGLVWQSDRSTYRRSQGGPEMIVFWSESLPVFRVILVLQVELDACLEC